VVYGFVEALLVGLAFFVALVGPAVMLWTGVWLVERRTRRRMKQ